MQRVLRLATNGFRLNTQVKRAAFGRKERFLYHAPISRGITKSAMAQFQIAEEKFDQDVKVILSGVLDPGAQTGRPLSQLHSEVRDILRELEDSLKIEDISTWSYGVNFRHSPIEFLIVDEGGSSNPLVHQAQIVEALGRRDFNRKTSSARQDPEARRLFLTGDVKENPSRPLSAQPVDPLVQLRRPHLQGNDRAVHLIVLVYLWARTANLPHFPLHVTTLMVLRYLQVEADRLRRKYGVVPQGASSEDSSESSPTHRILSTQQNSRFSFRLLLEDFLCFYSTKRDKAFRYPSGERTVEDPSHINFHLASLAKDISATFWAVFILQARHTISALQRWCPAGAIFALAPWSNDGILGSDIPRANGPDTHGIQVRSIQRDLSRLYKTSRPSTLVLMQRSKTIKRVEDVLRQRFGKQYYLQPFGSTTYGVDSADSDIDLIVLDPKRPTGFPPDTVLNQLPPIFNVRRVAALLYRTGFAGVEAIPKATVPIVKFRDPMTGLNGDININDKLGYVGATLISRYCEMLPLLRPLLIFIKTWAKGLGLNSPGARGVPRTFSSYALTLMTIGMFQTKGYLPNLHANVEGEPSNSEHEVFWFKAKDSARIKCDTRFDQMDDWTPSKELDIAEALLMWFQFWGTEFQYHENIMRMREGGVTPRERAILPTWRSRFGGIYEAQYMPRQGKSDSGLETDVASRPLNDGGSEQPKGWYSDQMVVPDPFVTIRNTTAGIDGRSLTTFIEQCRHALTMLRAGGSLQDLVPSLKLPHSPSRPPRTSKNTISAKKRTQSKPRKDNVRGASSPALQDFLPEARTVDTVDELVTRSDWEPELEELRRESIRDP